jgi:hypothetical protein
MGAATCPAGAPGGGSGGAVITGTWGCTVVVDVGFTVDCEVLVRGTVVVRAGCLPFEVLGCGVCGTMGSGGKFARVGDGGHAVTVANGGLVTGWMDLG